MIIKSIGVLSLGKFYGALAALFGLIAGVLVTLMSLFGAMAGAGRSGIFALLFGIGAIVFLPLFYGIGGFIGGIITAAFYNLASGIIGGVEIEVQNLTERRF